MNTYTIRFVIALMLAIGMTLVAASAADPACAGDPNRTVAAQPLTLDARAHVATASPVGSRSSVAWRSLLPGSMR